LRELGGGLVVEAAVRPAVVVVVFPRGGQPAGHGRVVELFDAEELVAQAAVEAFGEAVLPRRTRLDVQRIHLQFLQPPAHCVRGEFRAVITTDVFRRAVHREQFRQCVEQVFAADLPRYFERQTFPRVFIDNRKPLQPAPARRAVEGKIPRPHLARAARLFTVTRIDTTAVIPHFTLFSGHFQPLAVPQAVHPLVACLPAFVAKQNRNPAVAETRTLAYEIQHPLGNLRFIVARRRFVTLCAPRLRKRFAGAALADFTRRLHMLDSGALSRGA